MDSRFRVGNPIFLAFFVGTRNSPYQSIETHALLGIRNKPHAGTACIYYNSINYTWIQSSKLNAKN